MRNSLYIAGYVTGLIVLGAAAVAAITAVLYGMLALWAVVMA